MSARKTQVGAMLSSGPRSAGSSIAGIAVALGFLAGCGSSTRGPIIAEPEGPARPLAPLRTDDVSGVWALGQMCHGIQQRLPLGFELRADHQLTVRMKLPEFRQPLVLSGHMDPATGLFFAEGGFAGVGPATIRGAFIKDEQLALVYYRKSGMPRGEGPAPRCTFGIIARAETWDETLSRQVWTPERATRVDSGTCPERVKTWLTRYRDWVARESPLGPIYMDVTGPRTTYGQLRPPSQPAVFASAMYLDPSFVPLTGRGFAYANVNTLGRLRQIIRQPQRCGLAPDSFPRGALEALESPLSTFPRATALDVMVARALRVWAERYRATLPRFDGARAANPVGALERHQGGAAFARVALWAQGPGLDPTPLLDAIARTEHLLEEDAARYVAARCGEGIPSTLQGLDRVLDCRRRVLNYLDGHGAEIRKALSAELQPLVDRVGRQAYLGLIATQTGAQGYRQLKLLADGGSALFELSPPIEKALRAEAAAAAEHIASGTARQLDIRFRAEVQSKPTAPEQLAAAVHFESTVRPGVDAMANHAALASSRRAREQVRRQLLAQVAPAMIALVAKAETQMEAELVGERYIHPDDTKTGDAARFLAAIDARFGQIAPFRGLPGAQYLDPMVRGDFREVARVERQFMTGVLGRLGGVTGQWVEFMDQFFRFGGGRASVKERVLSASLAPMMLSTYVLNYQSVYPQRCLGENPAASSWQTVTTWVTKNGFGEVVDRDVQRGGVETFYVKRKLAPVFKLIGPEGGRADGDRVLSAIFATPGQLTALELVQGLRTAMRRLDCDSPQMLRFEDNLLRYIDLKRSGQL